MLNMVIYILPPTNKLWRKTVPSDILIDLVAELMAAWKGLHIYLLLCSANKLSPDINFHLGYAFQNILNFVFFSWKWKHNCSLQSMFMVDFSFWQINS